MIYLQDVLDKLSYGEFSGMAISNPMSGSSLPDQLPRLVSYINDGLLALYTRFKLKEKEFNLYQRTGKTHYYIRSAHLGDPLAGNDEIYVDGTGEDPPAGDIIRFLEAFDDDGEVFHINSPYHLDEITLPEPDIIRMTPSDPLKIISLLYQASYPKIRITEDFNPSTYELYFPQYLLRPLLAYVAMAPFMGKDNKVGEKGSMYNTHFYRYEGACQEVISLGLLPDRAVEDTRFEENGWV